MTENTSAHPAARAREEASSRPIASNRLAPMTSSDPAICHRVGRSQLSEHHPTKSAIRHGVPSASSPSAAYLPSFPPFTSPYIFSA